MILPNRMQLREEEERVFGAWPKVATPFFSLKTIM